MYCLDALVVLGKRLDKGGLANGIYLQRLRKAAAVYNAEKKAGFEPVIVLSGGYRDGLYVSEAEQGHSYLSKTIDEEFSCIFDEDSQDTLGNALYTKLIALEEGFKNIGLVTCSFHLLRSFMLFDHIYGDGFTIAPLGSGIGPDYRKDLEDEARKLAPTLDFISALGRGDHGSVQRYLKENGLLVEDS